MHQSGEDVDNGEVVHVQDKGNMPLAVQFCCKSKAAYKNKVLKRIFLKRKKLLTNLSTSNIKYCLLNIQTRNFRGSEI